MVCWNIDIQEIGDPTHFAVTFGLQIIVVDKQHARFITGGPIRIFDAEEGCAFVAKRTAFISNPVREEPRSAFRNGEPVIAKLLISPAELVVQPDYLRAEVEEVIVERHGGIAPVTPNVNEF